MSARPSNKSWTPLRRILVPVSFPSPAHVPASARPRLWLCPRPQHRQFRRARVQIKVPCLPHVITHRGPLTFISRQNAGRIDLGRRQRTQLYLRHLALVVSQAPPCARTCPYSITCYVVSGRAAPSWSEKNALRQQSALLPMAITMTVSRPRRACHGAAAARKSHSRVPSLLAVTRT